MKRTPTVLSREDLITLVEEQPNRLDFTDRSAPYITGNSLALRCGRYFAWGSLGKNPARDNDAVYVKTDDVSAFFASDDFPTEPFDLVTHNSDLAVDLALVADLPQARLLLVKRWFTQNLDVPLADFPTFHALPIGIANHQWPHGDVRVLRAAQAARGSKAHVLHASHLGDTGMNDERRECALVLEWGHVKPAPSRPWREYLAELSRACFVVCPRGRGIDTHRAWEALYMGAIPVVVRSPGIEQLSHIYPMVVLERWADFNPRDFSALRWARMWHEFDQGLLTTDGLCGRLGI